MPARPRYRLLALDADGTLLDPDGELRARVKGAVHAARDAGVQVVLCTGRRYRTAKPLIDELALEGPAVVHNGVLVKDAQSGATLRSRFLEETLFRGALRLASEIGPPLVYVDRYEEGLDLFTEPRGQSHPFQEEYVEDNADRTRFVDSLHSEAIPDPVMVSCMADEASLLQMRERLVAEFGSRVRTHLLMNKVYRGHILESVSAEAGKWPALRAVAEERGIAPEEIAAIGDDENDAEMIGRAGLGIAMGNAGPAAMRAADRIAASNAEDGAASAIEEWVLGASD